MSDIKDVFAGVLRKNGYSVTKPREAVFNAMLEQEPMSMNTLVQKTAKSIDRASVYRTIALFESLGIVHRLQMGWKYKLELSDLFNYHHHHITCTKCGAIVPLREDATLESALNALAQEYNYQPVSHQIEIQGICKKCQARRSS